jgi:hypothetical protein
VAAQNWDQIVADRRVPRNVTRTGIKPEPAGIARHRQG